MKKEIEIKDITFKYKGYKVEVRQTASWFGMPRYYIAVFGKSNIGTCTYSLQTKIEELFEDARNLVDRHIKTYGED